MLHRDAKRDHAHPRNATNARAVFSEGYSSAFSLPFGDYLVIELLKERLRITQGRAKAPHDKTGRQVNSHYPAVAG
jgi:hypothetical protein